MANHTTIQSALAHPVRRAILDRFTRLGDDAEILRRNGEVLAVASPKQIADEIKVSLGVVSYHFRRLASLGLVRLVRRVPRRGAVEHYYALANPLEDGFLRASQSDWATLPAPIRQAFAVAAAREVASRARGESPGGTGDADDPLGAGWLEVVQEVARLCADIARPVELRRR